MPTPSPSGVYSGQMTVSTVDWIVMWKLFQYQFFGIYLALGIPIRFVGIRHSGAVSAGRTSLSIVVASLASASFSTWLPVLPMICVVVLDLAAGHSIGNSLLIGVPLVAISMGIETAFLDAVLLRVLLKESAKKRFGALLIANILNASIALALGLAWAFHHLPIFLATADSCR